jgi:hypothetical protein
VAEIVKSQRGQPGGSSGGDQGALVPVGGVEAPAPRGAEHPGVWLAGEAVPVEMPDEYESSADLRISLRPARAGSQQCR